MVSEALDFPGAMTQGFDLADARVIDRERSRRPGPNEYRGRQALARPDSAAPDTDLIELIPLSVHAGSRRS